MFGNKKSRVILNQKMSRRGIILGSAAFFFTGANYSLGQVTDLDGYDAIWRDTKEALDNFFGNVEYLSHGLFVDLPKYAEVGSSVPITVRVDCEMTDHDFPKVIHVLANKNPGPHVMSAFFSPEAGRAEFSTRIRLEQSQVVTVAVKMSNGKHLRVDKYVNVSFGACGQVGEGDLDTVFNFEPKPKIRVPENAQENEIISLKALISHPMETGMRYDIGLDRIDARFISSFKCSHNGEIFFRVRLHPAIATNPYFSFYMRVKESGEFKFSWYDMTDITYNKFANIRVS